MSSASAKQREDAQARVLSRRFQRRVEGVEAEPGVSHKRHIKISLYGGKQIENLVEAPNE